MHLEKSARQYFVNAILIVGHRGCGRVLAFTTTPSVRNISSLLKNEKALPDLPQPEQPKNINRYGITRGAAYFKKGGEQE